MASPQSNSVSIVFSQYESHRARIAVSGRLDASTLPEAWAAAVEPTLRQSPAHLTVDLSGLSYCDGAGLGLFAELRRIITARHGEMNFSGVRPEQQRFVEMSVLTDPSARAIAAPPRRPGGGGGVVARVPRIGHATWLMLRDLRELFGFTLELIVALLWALTHPMKIRLRDTIRIAQQAGVNAVPVISLLGFLIGVILAFQSAGPLERFAAAQPLMPSMVSIAVIREMGPLITAVILAGRRGSAFAAEIGTMQVTEELSALKTFGIEPVRFLVIPRVLATVCVTPLLTLLNILMGLVGAYVVMAGLGYSFRFFVESLRRSVTYGDLIGGVAKSLVFGLIIACLGCLRGMQTQSGPPDPGRAGAVGAGAVGDSTMHAAVAGIVYCIAADAVIALLYYYLGI